ncbi:MAG: hybrid sensor histidine kinase/response regulator [Pseudomonadales bacterium]|nr:hybrid sensor histidine kinase/response regulator [Pseudomonadales bacterium]
MLDLPKVIVQNHISVMVLDYDAAYLRLLEFHLGQVKHGCYKTQQTSNMDEAINRLVNEKFDVCLIGYQLGSQTAFDFLSELKQRNLSCPCIVMTKTYDAELSAGLFAAGAVDFIISDDVIPQVLEHCIRSACMRNHVITQYRQEITRFSNHLANMSHELKSPLNIVMGFTHRLEKELVKTNQKAYNQYFELIHRNAQHMSRLISELLDLARLEAESVKLYYTRFNVLTLIDDVCDDLQGMADDHSIELKRPNASLKSVYIEADENRMRQVITNLLSNSIKYTEKGSVSIDLPSGDETPLDIINIAFRDTGIGIKCEDFEALFNKFETVHHRLEKKVDSTGLGLPITKELIDLHAGEISVESEVGVGSCFNIIIPQKGPKDVIVHDEDVADKSVFQ